MTEQQANFLHDAMQDAGLDCEIRDDYSGRYMFGRQTHALVVSNLADLLGPAIEQAAYLDEDELPDFEDFKPQVDDMGLEVVIY